MGRRDYIEDERDHGDYDDLEAKVKRRRAREQMLSDFTSTTSTASGEALSFAKLAETVDKLNAAHPVPIYNFKVQPLPKDVTVGIDIANGPDVTMLSTWRRDQLVANIEVKPYVCNWGYPFTSTTAKIVPFTRAELRHMGKTIRDKKGKQLLKRIARSPLLAEQDPRKLRRLARSQKLSE